MPQTVWLLAVFLPARAGEVAAHHALDGQRLGLLDDHASAAEVRRAKGWSSGRQADRRPRESRWLGTNRLGLLEPEMGELGQHLAFARDAIGHDAVEGRNPVRGDKQQASPRSKISRTLPLFSLRTPGSSTCSKGSFDMAANMKVFRNSAKSGMRARSLALPNENCWTRHTPFELPGFSRPSTLQPVLNCCRRVLANKQDGDGCELPEDH